MGSSRADTAISRDVSNIPVRNSDVKPYYFCLTFIYNYEKLLTLATMASHERKGYL